MKYQNRRNGNAILYPILSIHNQLFWFLDEHWFSVLILFLRFVCLGKGYLFQGHSTTLDVLTFQFWSPFDTFLGCNKYNLTVFSSFLAIFHSRKLQVVIVHPIALPRFWSALTIILIPLLGGPLQSYTFSFALGYILYFLHPVHVLFCLFIFYMEVSVKIKT